MTPRTYTMRARADRAAATRDGILRAVVGLATERLTIDLTLAEVAERAGVTTRTILRHFGDRDGLLDAAVAHGGVEIAEERAVAPGDPDAALRVLLDHYEHRGDFVIRLLAQEDDARIAPIVAAGRASHRRWVTDVFRDALPGDEAGRERAVDLLVVSTDVYAWKLLRRDRALDRAATESRMRELVALVAGAVTDEGSGR